MEMYSKQVKNKTQLEEIFLVRKHEFLSAALQGLFGQKKENDKDEAVVLITSMDILYLRNLTALSLILQGLETRQYLQLYGRRRNCCQPQPMLFYNSVLILN
jgi:hypothetical protein